MARLEAVRLGALEARVDALLRPDRHHAMMFGLAPAVAVAAVPGRPEPICG